MQKPLLLHCVIINRVFSRPAGATSNDSSVRWNTEGQEGLPEGWTLQVKSKKDCYYKFLDFNETKNAIEYYHKTYNYRLRQTVVSFI